MPLFNIPRKAAYKIPYNDKYLYFRHLILLLGHEEWSICNLRSSWVIWNHNMVCSLLSRSSLAKMEVTNWMISENEGETFSSPSWSRLNVWLSVLHRHKSAHEGTATRSASPCQSHIEQRAATNWKFWLWELYTTVIKQYKHPISEHEDPTDADTEKETEKEERLQQRWK
jgi:hypothetical protein